MRLNTPFKSDVKGKKYSVYVRDEGRVKKINFGGCPNFIILSVILFAVVMISGMGSAIPCNVTNTPNIIYADVGNNPRAYNSTYFNYTDNSYKFNGETYSWYRINEKATPANDVTVMLIPNNLVTDLKATKENWVLPVNYKRIIEAYPNCVVRN